MSKPSGSCEKDRCRSYVDTLDSTSRRRYDEKIKDIENIDPFEHPTWSTDENLLPKIEQEDIYDYLRNRVSFYTREQFKAEKQLGAHNQLTSGWVKSVVSYKPQGCDIIIKAEVRFPSLTFIQSGL